MDEMLSISSSIRQGNATPIASRRSGRCSFAVSTPSRRSASTHNKLMSEIEAARAEVAQIRAQKEEKIQRFMGGDKNIGRKEALNLLGLEFESVKTPLIKRVKEALQKSKVSGQKDRGATFNAESNVDGTHKSKAAHDMKRATPYTYLPRFLIEYCVLDKTTAIKTIGSLAFLASWTLEPTFAVLLSGMNGQDVTNVQGLVTAVASNGLWIRSTQPDNDPRTSESIFVFGASIISKANVGDIITLDGTVNEFRSSEDYVPQTEIQNPSNVQVVSSGNLVIPVVIGLNTGASSPIGAKRMQPPTEQYTSLDNGNVFGFPNNVSQISVANPVLMPNQFGMDFWESLSGEYVSIRDPVVLDVPNSFGDTWVVGNWRTTGKNGRGGLTITAQDGNPEAILIQTPLDGSNNRLDSKLGDKLETITGVIVTAFGAYTLRPQTAVTVLSSASPDIPPATSLQQHGGCRGLTLSTYNVDNLSPTDDLRNRLASQIVDFLNSPTLLFLNEIQDNSGSADDGTVSASQTLQNLAAAIQAAGGPSYSFVEIAPLDDTTGGEPGGNIRNAYLYNPNVIELRPAAAGPGNATQPEVLLAGPRLKFNPGLIAPNAPAFSGTRRPIIAEWQFVNVNGVAGSGTFFTVNNHDTSKGGSTTLFGDARPPVNLGITNRFSETAVTAAFIKQILKRDPQARIIASGDWNEFQSVVPQTHFVNASGLMDLDEVVGTTPAERYTFLFDQNSQALIHFYISPSLTRSGRTKAKFQRIHVNTWADFNDRVSDHDPDVVQLDTCATQG